MKSKAVILSEAKNLLFFIPTIVGIPQF